MHKSRLCGFIIDCQGTNLASDAEFWSHALGRRALPDEKNPQYVLLQEEAYLPGAPRIELQQVAHASRVHVDIETDNVEAEVRRLEQLGARRLHEVRGWWVMEAPSGHRFCVVQAVADDFVRHANTWP